MLLFIEGKGYFCPLFLIVLFSFSVKLSNLYYIKDQHIFESIKLSNNKILMLSNNGHYIMDSNFSNLIYQESSYSFSCCCKYNKLFYFSEEYILFYNCDYLVFISKEGQILSKNSFVSSTSSSIMPYGYDSSYLYFYYVYAGNNHTLYFYKYSYNLSSKSLTNNNYNKEIKYIYNCITTCQIMKYDNKNTISCFYQYSSNINQLKFFDVDNNLVEVNTRSISISINNKLTYSTSATTSGKNVQKLLGVFLDNNKLFYVKYDNSTDFLQYNTISYNSNIFNGWSLYTDFFFLSYFKETEEFIFSFVIYSNILASGSDYYNYIYIFDINFNIKFSGIIEPNFLTGVPSNTYNLFNYYFNDGSCHKFKIIHYSPISNRYFLIKRKYSDSYSLNLFFINIETKNVLQANYSLVNSSMVLLCENYNNYKNSSKYINSGITGIELKLLNSFDKNLSIIEKCSPEIDYIDSLKLPYNLTYIIVPPIKTPRIIETTIIETTIIETTVIETTMIVSTLIKTTQIEVPSTNIVQLKDKDCDIELLINNGICNNKKGNKTNIYYIIKGAFNDGSMDEVIDEVLTKGKDITINDKENNIIYQFISSDNKNNKNKANNISSIDLGECETILKQKYNISNISLLILKSDAFIDNSLIQVVQYEVYHPLNKTKLDLSYCSDTKIDIKIPVSINEDDLSKYEPNSDYYNNMCFSASSKNGADLSLKDRKNKFIEDNLTLCENNCDYLGYDRETKESNCECKVKQEMTIFNIKIDTGELKVNFRLIKVLI